MDSSGKYALPTRSRGLTQVYRYQAGVILSFLVLSVHLGGFAYISYDDSPDSPLPSHTSTSVPVPDGSRPPPNTESSPTLCRRTVDISQTIQDDSVVVEVTPS